MKPRVTASANQRRAFWRSFRLSLGWLWWQAYVLSHLGLLDRPGRASRWLSVRMSQLEHGLRCLLIIGCQALPRTAPPAALAPSSASSTQPAPPNPADAQLPDLDLPACELDMPGKARQLGLSLAAFNSHADLADPATPRTPGRAPAAPVPALAPAPRPTADDTSFTLAARLDAMLDIFENSDHHIARMARHLARQGITLRRRATLRPDTLIDWSPVDQMPRPAVIGAPALIDTS